MGQVYERFIDPFNRTNPSNDPLMEAAAKQTDQVYIPNTVLV